MGAVPEKYAAATNGCRVSGHVNAVQIQVSQRVNRASRSVTRSAFSITAGQSYVVYFNNGAVRDGEYAVHPRAAVNRQNICAGPVDGEMEIYLYLVGQRYLCQARGKVNRAVGRQSIRVVNRVTERAGRIAHAIAGIAWLIDPKRIGGRRGSAG